MSPQAPQRRGGEPGGARVLAIVMTHSAPDHLRRCVDAVRRQAGPAVDLLVVDVAGNPPAAGTLAEVDGVEHLRLEQNVGPAGGWHAGLERFLELGHELAWLMDDDCVPEAGAVSALVGVAEGDDSPSLVWPLLLELDTDRPVRGRGWCGALVSRSAVHVVGLPRRELVYWREDTEWFGRFAARGLDEARSPAVVRVALARPRASRPAWKYYYVIRNTVSGRIGSIAGALRSGATPRRRLVHAWFHVHRLLGSVGRLVVRIVVIDRTQVAVKLRYAARAVCDGWTGRLGLTVPLDDPDRPA